MLITMTEAVRRYHIDKDRLRQLRDSGVLTAYRDPRRQHVRLLDTAELDERLAPQAIPHAADVLIEIASAPSRLLQAALIERAGGYLVQVWDYSQRRACSLSFGSEQEARAALKTIKAGESPMR